MQIWIQNNTEQVFGMPSVLDHDILAGQTKYLSHN